MQKNRYFADGVGPRQLVELRKKAWKERLFFSLEAAILRMKMLVVINLYVVGRGMPRALFQKVLETQHKNRPFC